MHAPVRASPSHVQSLPLAARLAVARDLLAQVEAHLYIPAFDSLRPHRGLWVGHIGAVTVRVELDTRGHRVVLGRPLGSMSWNPLRGHLRAWALAFARRGRTRLAALSPQS